MKILALNGSPRKKGTIVKLLNAVISSAARNLSDSRRIERSLPAVEMTS